MYLDEPNELDLTASCPVFGMRHWEEPLFSVEQKRELPWKGRTEGEASSPVPQRRAMGMGPAARRLANSNPG